MHWLSIFLELAHPPRTGLKTSIVVSCTEQNTLIWYCRCAVLINSLKERCLHTYFTSLLSTIYSSAHRLSFLFFMRYFLRALCTLCSICHFVEAHKCMVFIDFIWSNVPLFRLYFECTQNFFIFIILCILSFNFLHSSY